MKKGACPFCGQEIELKETSNHGVFVFTDHRRRKTSDEDFEENTHYRHFPDTPCEGSGDIFDDKRT